MIIICGCDIVPRLRMIFIDCPDRGVYPRKWKRSNVCPIHKKDSKVTIAGKTSSWRGVLSGVPQGSVLWPLLFLIYINDLPDNIKSNSYLFADDVSLSSVIKCQPTGCTLLNDALLEVSKWSYQ